MMIKYKEWTCNVLFSKYLVTGNTAIMLVDADDGKQITTATVNMGAKLPLDQAYIKTYSENKGMLETLEGSGIVVEVIEYAKYGHAEVPLCRLNMDGITDTM